MFPGGKEKRHRFAAEVTQTQNKRDLQGPPEQSIAEERLLVLKHPMNYLKHRLGQLPWSAPSRGLGGAWEHGFVWCFLRAGRIDFLRDSLSMQPGAR